MLVFTTPLFSFASPLLCALKPDTPHVVLTVLLHKVGRVQVVLEPYEVFLDAARGHEAVEDRDATGLIVRAARACTAEWLLTDDRSCALLVVVDVACRVAEAVSGLQKHLAVRRETVQG